MGDRTAIVAEIGGDLPAAALEALCDAIADEGLALDWSEAPDATADDIRAAVTEGEPLRVMANETYAELDELAAFCREHGLAWRMCWDAYPGSYNAGGELHDDDGDEEYATDGTDGCVMLYASEIRELGSWEAVIARLDRLDRPLPPFRIAKPRKRSAENERPERL